MYNRITELRGFFIRHATFLRPDASNYDMTRFADYSVEDDVVERARKGDLSAHEILYRTYSTPVYNLAFRLTRHTANADEILQDTFIQVITKISTFRGEAQLGTWIREITVNKCLMHMRSGWQQKIRPMETIGPDYRGESDTDSISDRMDMEKALDMLPDISRTVVWLHDVEGYTHNEIGRLMGKSASFSKSQLARAHRRLQSLLAINRESGQQCMQLSNNY